MYICRMKANTRKKQQLIDTAKNLFSTSGFYGTPTAKIARDAGVSNGILFHYFPTKEDLIHSLYTDIKDDIFHYTLSQVYTGATLKESVYTLWLASVEWYIEHPNDFQFMLQFENSPYFTKEIERSHRYVQMAHTLIEQGMEQGVLKVFDPMFVVRMLSGMVERSVQYLQSEPGAIENGTRQNQLFEMAWDAISK
jgi:AcrR family transcriptional regulator